MRRSIHMALIVALAVSLSSGQAYAGIFDVIKKFLGKPPQKTEQTVQESFQQTSPQKEVDTEISKDDVVTDAGAAVEYTNIVDGSNLDAQAIVLGADATADDLAQALEYAQPGVTVFINKNAAIDLAGRSLCINEGVTLASNRGKNGSAGALIYTSERAYADPFLPILKACGDNVRITGLRIIGAEPTQCPPEYPNNCPLPDETEGANCRDCTATTTGVKNTGFDYFEIDNCELAGWTLGAIFLLNSNENNIHHNYIHHNQRQGLGYGIVLGRESNQIINADIYRNKFDYNRHSVAGSGERGQSYNAHHNVVLKNANGHIFDLHGEWETPLPGNEGSKFSGHEIRVHRNIVLHEEHPVMKIRGEPEVGAWLFSNCLAQKNARKAAEQRLNTGQDVPCRPENNCYVDEKPGGTSAPNLYDREASDCTRLRWCASSGGNSPWLPINTSNFALEGLAFGDFDGDGITDVFRATGNEWQWSRSGSERWKRLGSSSLEIDQLAFGNFDNDTTTDVFASFGGEWKMSAGGSSTWVRLNGSNIPVNELAFGHFDDDKITDVFRATGTEWQWSRNARDPWEHLNGSNYGIDDLVFADFDGDGITDVFRATGSEWLWSRSGREPWQHLNTSSIEKENLIFGDFNDDGETDILHLGGAIWSISWSGTSAWEFYRVGTDNPSEFAIGNFDDAPGADIFRTGCIY